MIERRAFLELLGFGAVRVPRRTNSVERTDRVYRHVEPAFTIERPRDWHFLEGGAIGRLRAKQKVHGGERARADLEAATGAPLLGLIPDGASSMNQGMVIWVQPASFTEYQGTDVTAFTQVHARSFDWYGKHWDFYDRPTAAAAIRFSNRPASRCITRFRPVDGMTELQCESRMVRLDEHWFTLNAVAPAQEWDEAVRCGFAEIWSSVHFDSSSAA